MLINLMNSPEHQTIEGLAYCIFLAEGRPEGRAEQHWIEAEQHWIEAEQLVEVEEQFEVESRLEPNIFGDKAVST